MPSNLTISRLADGVVFVALCCVIASSQAGVFGRAPQGAQDRIEFCEVTVSNLKAFETQFRNDLPVGTDRRDVEAYLSRRQIPYAYGGDITRNYDWDHVYTISSDIGMQWFYLFPVPTSLTIFIRLDHNFRISRIEFEPFISGAL